MVDPTEIAVTLLVVFRHGTELNLTTNRLLGYNPQYTQSTKHISQSKIKHQSARMSVLDFLADLTPTLSLHKVKKMTR